MADRAADRVTVPDVVGLPFHIGRDVAAEAGVALANPDPDGPPIAALTPEPPTPDIAHARADREFFTDLTQDNEPNP